MAVKAIRSIAIGIAGRASNQISAIVLTLIATRFLQPTDFGTFALASAFITLARTMLYMGAFEYQVKAKTAEECASECLAITVGVSLVWVVLLVAIGLASPLIFSSAVTGMLLLVLAPTPLVSSLASWQESLLLRERRLNDYYLVTALIEYASVGLAAMLLFWGFGVWSLAIQIYARAVFLSFAYAFMVNRPKLHLPNRERTREVFRWSIPRYASSSLSFASNYGADIMLGIFLGPAATGVYRASNRIATAVSDIFVQPANLLSVTILSRNRAESAEPDGQWLKIFSVFALIGFPALGGLAILADKLVPVVLGNGWDAAAPVLMVICVAKMIGLLNSPASTNLVVQDRQGMLLRLQMVMVMLSIAATIVSAPFGSVAVASSQLLTTGISMGLLLWLNFRHGTSAAHVWRSMAVVGPPVAAACGSAWAGVFLAKQMGATSCEVIAIAVAAGAAAWLAVIALLRHRIAEELSVLSSRI